MFYKTIHEKYVLSRIERYIPDGCVFKLDLQAYTEQLTKVEFKLTAETNIDDTFQWHVISDKKHKSIYYISEKRGIFLYIKVENFRFIKVEHLKLHNYKAELKFSFQDSTGNNLSDVYDEVLIPGMHLISIFS